MEQEDEQPNEVYDAGTPLSPRGTLPYAAQTVLMGAMSMITFAMMIARCGAYNQLCCHAHSRITQSPQCQGAYDYLSVICESLGEQSLKYAVRCANLENVPLFDDDSASQDLAEALARRDELVNDYVQHTTLVRELMLQLLGAVKTVERSCEVVHGKEHIIYHRNHDEQKRSQFIESARQVRRSPHPSDRHG